MLAYNCIWIHGETGKEEDKEFLKLAEKVKLLSALEKEELIKPSHNELLERYKTQSWFPLFASLKKIAT